MLCSCIQAKGFPPDICPAEVARAVFTKTGATIDKIAPSTSADSRSPGWLLYLPSHDDQINCLHHHRTFTVALNDESYLVKLDLPHMSLNASELDWIVINKGEDKMDSVDSEALFGSGGAGSADPNSNRTDSGQPIAGSFQGYHQHHPFPGQMGSPYLVGQGYAGQYPQPMDQEHYPSQPQGYPQHREHGYPQSPHDGLYQQGHRYSHGSDPDFQGHGANYPTARRGKEYPNNSPFPQHLMGRGRGLQFDFYNQQQLGQHFHQRSPANPEGEARAESLPQAMGDLNLKQDPFPHCDSFENQPAEFYGDAIGSPERDDYQSDFVVLEDTRPQESPQHHHHFHLQVTDLPDAITTKELVAFFENRKESGGGPVTDVNHNQSTRSAAIYFFESDSNLTIERIMKKRPLLLKNKKITVKPVSAEQQEAKTEVKTVEIRGLTTEKDTEMSILYFENPRKGGGDIENSNWDDKEKILYITFEEPEVAKSVASKGHKVGGNVLEVMLYTPPVEVEPEEMEPSCTVEVRGFDPAKPDLYEMYFSNPKKGGDDIADLRFSEDKSVMYITFESPEVADRVASLPHKVGGQLLEVMIAPIEDPTPPSTVMVKGLDLRKGEVCRLYFENPRKGGGDIAELVVDEDQEAIFITFEDPEVAQKVITMPHKIGGRDLEVSLYTPKKAAPMRHKSQEPAEEEEEAPLRTVVFHIGQETSESEVTYALYFESPRHGGGEVEAVNIDKEKGLVYVTFEEPSVAESVVGKTHRISGHQVEVTLYQPPKPRPTYPDKLLFKNIADSTTRDCLCMYLKRITGQDPAEVLYGDEVGTVLVTFAEESDLVKTAQFCQKRKLEGRQLTVAKVPISNCLLVENLNDRTTEDTVELYFENKRSGGGAVEKVEMVPEENKCFVFFEDHEVLDGVLQKPHKIDGAQLSVKRYMQCLGQSGGSQDPTAFTAPKPVVMTNVDPYKVAFLRQSQEIKAGFLQQLSNSHAEVKFEGDNLSIACSLNPSVPKARILARTWATDVQQVAGEFLGMIDVLKRRLVQQIWPEVETAVRSANIASPKGATFFPVPDESAFVVVGMKSMAKDLLDKINFVATKVEDEIERKSQEVTETNSKLEPYKLRLLLAMGFQIEAGKRHEGLRIDININIRKNCIVFQGMLKDVKESQVEMYETLQAVTHEKITEMSDIQKKVLDTKETKSFIVQKFKADKIAAVWEIGQKGEVMVHAFNDKNLVKAVHIIKKSVPEHVCQLNPESAQLLISQDWKSLVNRQTSAHPGLLLIAPSHDNQQVFIACTDNIMHGVVEDIEMFLRENTIYSQVMRFSPSRQVFIHSHWQSKLQNIGEKLRAYRVQLSLKDAGMELYVKGTEQGLQEVRKNLEQLGEKIICHDQVCTDQGTVTLLNSNCEKDLKMIGRGSRCVLGLQREPADLQVVQSSHPVAASPGQMGDTANTAASVQLPSGVSMSVMQGDITQMPVDAIVNAANARMDHVGGLARDIVDKGGDTIQAECYKNLKTRANQLKEGDVLVSGSGRLPCKIIIHAVGPMYKGGRAGEEECLYETVMKCMETINLDGYSSIAIPAIGTGICGYPARESTRVIVEAVKAFLDSHRRCTIKNVYFCHVGGDIVQLFTTAVQTTFPSARSTSTAYKPAAVPRKGAMWQKHSVPDSSTQPGDDDKTTTSEDIATNHALYPHSSLTQCVSLLHREESAAASKDECKAEHSDVFVTPDAAKGLSDESDDSCRVKADFRCCYCSNDSSPSSQSTLDGESEDSASSSDSSLQSTEYHQTSSVCTAGKSATVLGPDQGLPSPVFSRTWQAASLFTRKGGTLRKPGSDVILHVPPYAVKSDDGVEVHAAVCADVAQIRCLLKVSEDEQVVSPLAEFWAGRDFRFHRPVSVALPHWLPENHDPALVQVYHVTRSNNGHVDFTELNRRSQKSCTSGSKDATSLSDPDIGEVGYFSLEEDQISVFIDHFSGFVCTYCLKKGKTSYRPELYLTASGSISVARDSLPAHVDMYAHVWDKRITVEACRQAYGIGSGPLKCIELLPNLKHSKLELGIRRTSELVFRLDLQGQLLHPGETKKFDLISSFGCTKCDITGSGRQLPKSHQWAMQFPPGCQAKSSMEVAVDVTHMSGDATNPEEAATTLVVKVEAVNDQRSTTTQTDWTESDSTIAKHVVTGSVGGQLSDNSTRSRAYVPPSLYADSNGDASGTTCHHVPASDTTASLVSRREEGLCRQNGAAGLCREDTASGSTSGAVACLDNSRQVERSLQGAQFTNCRITFNANTHNNNVNKLGKMNTGNTNNSHYNVPAEAEPEAMDYEPRQLLEQGDIPVVEMPDDASLLQLQESRQDTSRAEDTDLKYPQDH